MLGEVGEFELPSVGDVTLLVQRRRDPSANAATPLERFALLTLRSGLEASEPAVVEVVRNILSILGEDFVPGALSSSQAGRLARQAELIGQLERAFASGRIRAERRGEGVLREREAIFPELPPLPPAKREAGDSFFEVRFVDETGQALSGVRASFVVDAQTAEVSTNAAGVALLEPAKPVSATVTLPEVAEVEKLLDPRWMRLRPGQAPRESNTREVSFSGAAMALLPIKSAQPHLVVLKPVLGKIHVRLVDKRNRVIHANRKYSLTGPLPLSGVTDERGELLHTGLPYADFVLGLELDDGLIVEAPVVVLDEGAPVQVRRLGVVPYVELAELRGLFFATNKSFLLPATTAVFERVRRVYEQNTPSKLLIVGHTDTTSDPQTNDPLSLERAKNTLAYLRDDVDAWLKMYDAKIAQVRRWGSEEDEGMISAMPDFDTILPGEDLVRWFQRTRNLEVDGIAGPKTRRQLITEYMSLDGVSLADPGFEIEATLHGAGENFPLDDSQRQVDSAAEDDFEDQGDRRVELFFFDPDFGIQPPPPGDNSKPGDTQYLRWREAVARHELADTEQQTVKLRCVDELEQPLPGLTFRLETPAGRTFAGTLDADGRARLFVGTSEPCRLFLSGIDEAALGLPPEPREDAVTSAVLVNAGIQVLPGAIVVVHVGLGELLVMTDDDDDDLDTVEITLQSADGSFSQSLKPAVDGVPGNGGIELVFRGLPTIDRTFTLTVKHSDGEDRVFDGVPFIDLPGVSGELQALQVEPTQGGEDGRISQNETESDDGLETATV